MNRRHRFGSAVDSNRPHGQIAIEKFDRRSRQGRRQNAPPPFTGMIVAHHRRLGDTTVCGRIASAAPARLFGVAELSTFRSLANALHAPDRCSHYFRFRIPEHFARQLFNHGSALVQSLLAAPRRAGFVEL
jgi:hypothetical protein